MAVKHKIEHDLDLDLAKRAVNKAMEGYSERFADYNPCFDWVSDMQGRFSFKAKGVSVKGELEILPSLIQVDVDVPFLLRMFKGRAIEVIDKEVRKWVERAKNGEI